jgi:hypothetical protein
MSCLAFLGNGNHEHQVAHARIQCRLHDTTHLEVGDAEDVFLQKGPKLLRVNEIFGAMVMVVDAMNIAVIVRIEPYKIKCLWCLRSHTFDIVYIEL